MPIRNNFVRDANNQVSSAPLRVAGAVVPVEVHVPQAIAQVLNQQAKPIPAAVTGLALIDTGASRTCVHEASLTSLGLNPISVVNSGTARGVVQQSVYPARLVFPTHGWTLDFVGLAGVDLSGQTIPVNPPQQLLALVGRDLLESCVLIWNGPAGEWTITW